MPKVSTLLDHIDSGHIVLPVFQRGYVWNRDQVKNLFESMYRRHPVGGILVWATKANSADHRGDGPIADGTVKFLLDGQQRITSLYGVIRGKAPDFFDGDVKPFTDLMFNLDSESFSFYQPVKMKDDPLWIDLTKLMKYGVSHIFKELQKNEKFSENTDSYTEKLLNILNIKEINLPDQEITGSDKDISTVVDIFNRVNSGGTKLSKGDLALATICSEWPEARDKMKGELKRWSESGYKFSLDWLLRSVNIVATGEAKFNHLKGKSSSEIQASLKRASKYIDESLNLIGGGLGLDHDRVFFGRFGVPIMVRYLDMNDGKLDAEERDKLLFWFSQAGMWGRFSASTETVIDQDIEALKASPNALDTLLGNLRQFRGNLHIEPSNFIGSTRGARFYPVLYMLTRMGDAKDWGNGITLKSDMHGNNSSLELHHIFPKSQLKKKKYKTSEINSLGNFCFQTKGTNLRIGNRLPEDYFLEVDQSHPGALESHFIPMDKDLWKIDKYLDFLEERRILLAKEANSRFRDLLHGDVGGLMSIDSNATGAPISETRVLPSEFDEGDLEELNDWVESCGLCRGETDFDLSDPESGEQIAVLDLAWPQGLQFDLTGPVAVLSNDSGEVIKMASAAGYRCFTEVDEFRNHVKKEFQNSES